MTPWREAVSKWGARRMLGRCDAVGARICCEGTPFVENLGEIVVGKDVVLRSVPVRSHLVTGAEGRISIGNGVQIGHGVSICSHCEIVIGEGTVIGPGAVLVDVDFHEIGDRGSIGEARPIHIGRHVVIGAGAVILRGAFIGDGAVIAPNSVVARRIPAGLQVAGVPARPMPS